jgi:hypothetical protein
MMSDKNQDATMWGLVEVLALAIMIYHFGFVSVVIFALALRALYLTCKLCVAALNRFVSFSDSRPELAERLANVAAIFVAFLVICAFLYVKNGHL